MSTTRKRKPARFDADNFQPVVIKRTGEEAERVHLFSIVDDDGTERAYSIPKKVKFNVSLKVTELYATEGEIAATAYMLRQLLGEEGYRALVDFDELEQDDFERICEIASNIVLGQRESGKAR